MVQYIPGGGAANIQQLLGSMTLGQLQALSQTNPQAAASLLDTFARLSGAPLQQILGGQIAGSGYMPSPGQALQNSQPICGCGYRQTVDLKQGASNSFWSRNFGSRTEVAQFERLLRRDPNVRASFEQAIGGRIVDFGSKNDGVFTVERFPGSAAPLPGQAFNPLANNALNLLGGMDAAVMQQAAQLAALQGGGGANFGGPGIGSALAFGGLGALTGLMSGAMYGNPMLGLVTGGLGSVLMGMGGGMGFGGGFGMLTGQGMGSWNPLAMPGRIQNSNPLYERAHQAQVASVLYDPSLTVEDKVTLMLMLIMKKQDRDIERQAQYINSIQQQQSNRNQMGGMMQMLGGVAGTVFGGPVGGMLGGTVGGMMGGGSNSPSIDVETMKLKRMIDKRSQMFDMLRQIIDKYNETAKNIIQSIGR